MYYFTHSLKDAPDLGKDFGDKFRAIVYYTGSVYWAPGSHYTTYCRVDLSQFPFDSQTCTISFISVVYNAYPSGGINFPSLQV